MNREKGTVVEVRGGKAIVETSGGEACASCSARHACVSMGGTKKITMENKSGAAAGDEVEFVIHDLGMLLSSIIVYGVPLIFLVIGIVIGPMIGSLAGLGEEPSAAIGGILGTALALGIIRLLHLAVGKNRVFTPVMLRITHRRGQTSKNVNNAGEYTDNT